MINPSLKLYIEINNLNFIFFVCKIDEENNFHKIYEKVTPIEGIKNNCFSDLEKAFNTIKENIYLTEQKFNYTFKEVILILENLNSSLINISGFKKLNGSQIVKENITYILNTLKSCVDENESKKTILHIFNSKFNLDNKNIENLPIGLFGDFYSHELAFVMLDQNNYKNLKNILEKCNLKIRKVLLKSFIKGVFISDKNINTENFFQIKFDENESKIFFFENNSLKFEQEFKFGINIILKDISKVTALKLTDVKTILKSLTFNEEILDDELLEQSFFEDSNYKKIKKKLIHDIAIARIQELLEILLFENVNLKFYNKLQKNIFFETKNDLQFKSIEEIFKKVFLSKENVNFNLIDNFSNDSMLRTANKLVQFGWKKEAIPITQSKKSLIARFFEALFG